MNTALLQPFPEGPGRRYATFAPAVNAGVVAHPPGATLGPRLQRDYQLVLMHTGSAMVSVDGAPREIRSGHVALLLPGHTEYFTFAPDRQTHHSWVALRPEQVGETKRLALDGAPATLVLSQAMQEVVELATTVLAVDLTPEYPVLVEVARAALMLYLAEASRTQSTPRLEHPVVAQARMLMRQQAGEDVGVAQIARAVGVSPEHLSRLFRRYLGVAPWELLCEERLRIGMQLLEHSGLSVAEIARRSGFGTPQHFARVLRAKTGLAPTEHRARTWAQRQTPVT